MVIHHQQDPNISTLNIAGILLICDAALKVVGNAPDANVACWIAVAFCSTRSFPAHSAVQAGQRTQRVA